MLIGNYVVLKYVALLQTLLTSYPGKLQCVCLSMVRMGLMLTDLIVISS